MAQVNDKGIIEAARCPGIGTRVRVDGYRGDWVVAEHREYDMVRVRTEEPTDVSGHATCYGTSLIGQRDRYVWMTVPITAVSPLAAAIDPGGVVTRLVRSVDSHGAYKKAIVTGKRFPEVAFHDPSWTTFLETLYQRGYIVPPDVPVELGVADGRLGYGVYPLAVLLEVAAPCVSNESGCTEVTP